MAVPAADDRTWWSRRCRRRRRWSSTPVHAQATRVGLEIVCIDTVRDHTGEDAAQQDHDRCVGAEHDGAPVLGVAAINDGLHGPRDAPLHLRHRLALPGRRRSRFVGLVAGREQGLQDAERRWPRVVERRGAKPLAYAWLDADPRRCRGGDWV